MSTDALPVLTTARFRQRPGCPLVPRLRRLFDSRPDEKGAAHPGHSAGENGVHFRHRLLQPVSVLHEHLRHPLDSRPRPGGGHGLEVQPARSVGVGHHRRRRRAFDRRQPLDARHPPQSRYQHRAVQQPHLRSDEGTILAHFAAGQNDQEHAGRRDRQPASSAFVGASAAKRRLSPARST